MAKGRLFDPRRKDGSFPFEYVPAAATDVKATIARARREQAEKKAATDVVVKRIADRRR
jgi:hypothetical protein